MAINQRDFLGRGLKFPLQVDQRGRLATAANEQRIEEAIALILGTAVGERLMLPAFGCGIHQLVFEPNNTLTQGRIAQAVRLALVENEPRIDVESVLVESPPGQQNLLLIRIDYRIRTNNAARNLVYPFFLSEGG
jgi:uncharacterized protein